MKKANLFRGCIVLVALAVFGATGHDFRHNARGGCAIYLHMLAAEAFRGTLGSVQELSDVSFEPGRVLRYIHNRWNDRHIYFCANLNSELDGSTVARIQLSLPYLKSLFLVSGRGT